KIYSLNIKSVYSGGLRSTPVDIEQSKINGYTVYIDKEAFSIQNPAYFRTDIRVSMKWNRKHHASTLSLDIQNVTNRNNIYTKIYDALTNDYKVLYQTGLIPVLNYRFEF
ncbi:MAG: TonB-dependent receptor, partial [Chitinophagaceae bacterium]|nr:TonB-dependent receptor [Chitinophagaceae bacterium]